jgi:hypothetical protein
MTPNPSLQPTCYGWLRQEYSSLDAAQLAAKKAVPWVTSLAELGRHRGAI